MEVKTVTIRNRTFRCELCLAPALGNLSLTSWRKLLRLAADLEPWEPYHDENKRALLQIYFFLPDVVSDANAEAEAAEAKYQQQRKPLLGEDPIERSRIKDHNDQLKWAAQEARARYRKLSKMLEALIEETYNFCTDKEN